MSTLAFTDMPSSATLCIALLNYTDATDSVEVDINVTVPSDEPPGLHNTTVTLTGSLAE